MNNQINFGSRINFINNNRFNSLAAEAIKDGAKYSGGKWGINDSVTAKEVLTSKASVCTIGGINNGEKCFLFHLVPRYDIRPYNLHEMRNVIMQKAGELKREGPLRGLLLGSKNIATGDIVPPNIQNHLKELNVRQQKPKVDFLAEFLSNTFDELGIKTTKLLGQPDGCYINAHFSTPKDTWNINAIGLHHQKANEHFALTKIDSGDQIHIDRQI